MFSLEKIVLYILLFSTIMALTATYFLFRGRKTPGTLYFSLVALSVSIWSIGYIVEFYARTLEYKFLGVQIQYTFGIPFSAIFWLAAAINMRTLGKRPIKREIVLLLIIPVITMILMWTNQYHNLVYEKMSLFRDNNFLLIQKEIGIWYYVNVAYSYSALFVGSFVLVFSIRKVRSLYKGQLILYIIIAILPWIANFIYITGMNSYMRIDITPIAFTCSMFLVEFGSRRFKLFNLVPAAHNVLIESMDTGLIIVDNSNRIIEINPAMEGIFESKEIVGKDIEQLFIENGVDTNFTSERNPIEVELGKEVFDMKTSLIENRKQEQVGKVHTLHNITKRKRSEEELRLLNTSKDKFFSIIAHDLRSPFFGIIGLSNLLADEYDDLSEEERKSFSTEIRDLATNTYQILENLLDWSRQQTGKMEYIPRDFNLSQEVNEFIHTIEQQLNFKKLTLVVEMEEQVGVFADKHMINTVIRNLISNAVKFSPPGGQIIISIQQDESYTTVAIKDNGVGMDEITLNKLFKIDKEVKSTGTMGEKGTGLGLILCKEFVEKNGGEISVTSHVNKGSEFIFTIPIK